MAYGLPSMGKKKTLSEMMTDRLQPIGASAFA